MDDGWMVDGWMEGCMDEWMDGWKDAWMDGWVEGRMDDEGWMDDQRFISSSW